MVEMSGASARCPPRGTGAAAPELAEWEFGIDNSARAIVSVSKGQEEKMFLVEKGGGRADASVEMYDAGNLGELQL